MTTKYAVEIKTKIPGKGLDARWARVAIRSTKREADAAMRDWLRDRAVGSKGRIVRVEE